jgi:hypothetical protein
MLNNSSVGAQERFQSIRSATRQLITSEVILYVIFNILVLKHRLPLATQAPLPYSVFVSGFISSYTMAIHLGWLIGMLDHLCIVSSE